MKRKIKKAVRTKITHDKGDVPPSTKQKTPELLSIDEIKDKYSVRDLKKLATKHKIKGRSKLKTEDSLIEALLKAGVSL